MNLNHIMTIMMLFNPIFHEAIYIVGRFSRDFMVMNFQVEHDGTTSSLSYFMVYIYISYMWFHIWYTIPLSIHRFYGIFFMNPFMVYNMAKPIINNPQNHHRWVV